MRIVVFMHKDNRHVRAQLISTQYCGLLTSNIARVLRKGTQFDTCFTVRH